MNLIILNYNYYNTYRISLRSTPSYNGRELGTVRLLPDSIASVAVQICSRLTGLKLLFFQFRNCIICQSCGSALYIRSRVLFIVNVAYFFNLLEIANCIDVSGFCVFAKIETTCKKAIGYRHFVIIYIAKNTANSDSTANIALKCSVACAVRNGGFTATTVADNTANLVSLGGSHINAAPPDALGNSGGILTSDNTTHISEVANILSHANVQAGIYSTDSCFACVANYAQSAVFTLFLGFDNVHFTVNSKILHCSAKNIAEQTLIRSLSNYVQPPDGESGTIKGTLVWIVRVTDRSPFPVIQVNVIHQLGVNIRLSGIYLGCKFKELVCVGDLINCRYITCRVPLRRCHSRKGRICRIIVLFPDRIGSIAV